LLTGAAGIIGSLIRPMLAQRYEHVVLTDIVQVDGIAENEDFFRGDIVDSAFLPRITADVDGIVHLAGKVGPNYSFDEVLGANIVGTHNVFAAARARGISRVVYASSHHAVGYWKRGDHIDETAPPRPDSQYGLSKAFGESVASYYADKFGINVLAIRIGFASENVIDERRLHTWISPRDLVQLINIGLTTPDLGFEVVYGVSNNPEPFFDNTNAERLGYQPQDRAIEHLADPSIPDHRPDPTTVDGALVGGPFALLGFVGDPRRVLHRSEKHS
jgi:uronate dehydrogenase